MSHSERNPDFRRERRRSTGHLSHSTLSVALHSTLTVPCSGVRLTTRATIHAVDDGRRWSTHATHSWSTMLRIGATVHARDDVTPRARRDQDALNASNVRDHSRSTREPNSVSIGGVDSRFESVLRGTPRTESWCVGTSARKRDQRRRDAVNALVVAASNCVESARGQRGSHSRSLTR